MEYRKQAKLKIGAVELCDLPELGIEKLHMRVDTGAATSSLHVDNIKEYSEGKKNFVSFDLHPDIHNVDKIIHTAPWKLREPKRSRAHLLILKSG